MAQLIKVPALIKAAGNKEKRIEEFVGRVNSNTGQISIARMKSPEGWVEPGQCPHFEEYTVVLKGKLKIKTTTGEIVVNEGQAVIVSKNEWVQYSTPFDGGAEYIAVCLPAFSPGLVNRDEI
jgi:mannose-6-phosphate isomerase-like protein (cupin superfamily)